MGRLKNSALMLLLVILSGIALACTPNQTDNGEIVGIEDAYGNNLLTTSDLQNIAYYMGCYENTDFLPTPKNPTSLSIETELRIKRLYLKDLQKEYPQATVNDVVINSYYGTYGSCIAVRLSNKIAYCDYLFEDEKNIGGVMFNNYCGAFVSIIVMD